MHGRLFDFQKITSMIIDSHVHTGQFKKEYYSPAYTSRIMGCVDFYAVSSTSICEENYIQVIDELHECIEFDGDKVLPMMWITPEGLKGNIAWFIESDIKWRCLKVHPFLHQNDWIPDGEQFTEVIDIARELQVPLLIHTGNEDCCQCGRYETLIANNPDVDFILAHGRPLKQAVPILKEYPNAYADSAFMPIDDMKILIDMGFSHKLLWGTDMCIPKHFYPNEDMVEYYLRKLNAFKSVCTVEEFVQVTFRNAAKLFNLKITD